MFLLFVGRPDKPQTCRMHNATETTSTVVCIPGFDGGKEVDFSIETDHNAIVSHVSTSPDQNGGIPPEKYIRFEKLWAGTEFKFRIYAVNSIGKSSEAYTVTVRTSGGQCIQKTSQFVHHGIIAL